MNVAYRGGRGGRGGRGRGGPGRGGPGRGELGGGGRRWGGGRGLSVHLYVGCLKYCHISFIVERKRISHLISGYHAKKSD